MTEIIGVRFKDGGKVYYFNPNGVPVQVGQHVIIETSKGIEFGECALANTMVDEMELIAALRPMLRIATEEDLKRVEANRQNEKKAFAICQEKILEHKLEMKLVEVKYNFDGSKILFFFTADGRVDFRHLVKDLAAVLEAYQKDLSMLSFSEIDEANCVLHFQNRGQAGSSWNSEQYPISGDFKNTIRLLAKLVEEQNQK